LYEAGEKGTAGKKGKNVTLGGLMAKEFTSNVVKKQELNKEAGGGGLVSRN